MKHHFGYRPAIAALVLALAVPFAFGGCVAVVAAGAAGGTVAYVQGALTTVVSSPLPDVQKAVAQAMRIDLKFFVLTSSEDALCARYEARTALDEKVVIKLEKIDDDTTRIDIRVGIFGDESLSRQILDVIKTRLS